MVQSFYIKGAAAAASSCDSIETTKTGQTTSYRTGDDGDYESGRDTSFMVLGWINPHGNTERFTDELGTQAYSNDIVIDWTSYNQNNSTVSGFSRLSSTSSWNDAIDNALSYSIGIFTSGWRLPNINELLSIARYEGATGNIPYNYTPFNISFATSFWSSTTNPATTTNAMYFFNNTAADTGQQAKTLTFLRSIKIRTFTVTGTTLT